MRCLLDVDNGHERLALSFKSFELLIKFQDISLLGETIFISPLILFATLLSRKLWDIHFLLNQTSIFTFIRHSEVLKHGLFSLYQIREIMLLEYLTYRMIYDLNVVHHVKQ